MTIPGLGLLTGLFGATPQNAPAATGTQGGGGDGESPIEVAFAAVLLGALVTDSSEQPRARISGGAFGALAGGGPAAGEAEDEVSEGEGPDPGTEIVRDPGNARRGERPPMSPATVGHASRSSAASEGSEPSKVYAPEAADAAAVSPSVRHVEVTSPSEPAPDLAPPAPDLAPPAPDLARPAPATTAPVAEVPREPVAGTAHATRTAPAEPGAVRTTEPPENPEVSAPAGAETATSEPADNGSKVALEPLSADRDVSRLHPELQERLARVVERMQLEYGHRVKVVEGYRTPERQAQLYEQGRSQPGPVVTWTTDSRHSLGRAVDLQVDGTWTDATAYARLQKVAGEEGLLTLGARDRGHVELATSKPSASMAPPPRPIDGWTAPKPEPSTRSSLPISSGMAPVAEVAAVAGPARVVRTAAAASPARVAVPGMRVGSPRGPSESGVDRMASDASVAAEPAAGALAKPLREDAASETALRAGSDNGGREAGGGARSRQGNAAPTLPLNANVTASESSSRHRDAGEAGLQGAERRSADSAAQLGELAGDTGSWTRGPDRFARELTALTGAGTEAAERVERIQQLRDAAGPSGPSELRLDLDEREGLGARIRMALRGSSVEAMIDMDDPLLARRLEARIGELHRALEARGLEPATLGVRTLRPVVEAADPAALKGGPDPTRTMAAGESTGMDTGARRERSAGDGDDRSRGWDESFDRPSQDPEREGNRDR